MLSYTGISFGSKSDYFCRHLQNLNPKIDQIPALQIFGAGREKRIYAIPPYTEVKSLDFEDHPFSIETWDQCCAMCGDTESYLDEVITDDEGTRMFVCSDTDHCRRRRDDVSAPGRHGSRPGPAVLQRVVDALHDLPGRRQRRRLHG